MTSCELNRRILVIDDNRSIHEDFRKTLGRPAMTATAAAVDAAAHGLFNEAPVPVQRAPYEIDSAYQGEDALKIVQQAIKNDRRYALAFVDLRMPPGWDGVETIKHLWQADPDIQVVICSAFSDYSWEDIIRELGVTDKFLILRKPFETSEVQQLASALTMKWYLSQAAFNDPLTGIANRRTFYDRLSSEIERSRRYATPLACVLFDIDFFKAINDTQGHATGDDVLCMVADVLVRNSRPNDLVARLGGDEFCALLPQTSEDGAAAWAEIIRNQIAELDIQKNGAKLDVSASFGVASYENLGLGAVQFVECADSALCHAKLTGRNRVGRYSVVQRDTQETLPSHGAPDAMRGPLLARDIMTPAILTFREKESAEYAMQIFIGLRLSSAPVVDDDGHLTGIVSEQDILIGRKSGLDWSSPVYELMSRNVVTYEEDAPARSIYDYLCRAPIRRVVIVNDGKPTGVVSRGTVLRWFSNWHEAKQPAHKPGANAEQNAKRSQLSCRADGTLDALIQLSQQLRQSLSDDDGEPMVRIVSEATKIQELATDLLACAASFEDQIPGEPGEAAGATSVVD